MSKRVQGFIYLVIVLTVRLGYTLIAEVAMESKQNQNVFFITFLGQFTLSLFMIPSTIKLFYYGR